LSPAIPPLPTRTVALALGGLLPVQFAAARWLGDPDLAGGGFVLLNLILPAAAGLFWLWFAAVWREDGGWRTLGFLPPTPGDVRLGLYTGCATLALAIVLAVLLQPWFGGASLPPEIDPAQAERTPAFLLGMLAAAAVLAPLLEEATFRGLFYGWLRRYLAALPAALLAALPHALLHGDPIRAVPLVAVFFVFGLLYERTRTLWTPVAAHAAHNLLAVFLGYGFAPGA